MSKSVKGNIEAAFPLTPLQEGMLYHALRDPGSGFYHGQVCFRVGTPIRAELLRRSFQRAADRHESLRTFFAWKGRDRPLQVVRRKVEIPWTELDWRDKTEGEIEASWHRLLAEDAAHPFSLSEAPLTRVTLVRCGDDAYRVLWSVHHGVSDGWSGSLIVREVLEDYDALAAGEPPPDRPAPPSFARFVGWIESKDLDLEERYWRSELGSFDRPTALPFSTGESTRRAGWTRRLELPGEIWARLVRRAAEMRVTPATVVAGAWALLLSRYAGEEQVVFGSTVSERPATISGVNSATGLYLNTVPVRAEVASGTTPAAFLQALQATMSAGRAHGVAGLSRIARWSGLGPGDPLFHTVVVFESFPEDVDLAGRTGLRLSHVSIDGPSDLPLGLVAIPGDGLTLELKHDPGLYDTKAADRLLGQLQHLLVELTRPDVSTIDELTYLPGDHASSVAAWSRGPDLSGIAQDVIDLFERAVDREPERTALSTSSGTLSYRELDNASNALAREIGRRGVGPGSLVAVPASRSCETVVAFLSVLKAGAAYSPMDPDLPPVRRTRLLESFDLVLRPDPGVWTELDIPAVDVALQADPPFERPSRPSDPQAPAYVVFTSGSTGEPKGVVVTRSNLAHSNAARFDAYDQSPAAFLLLSPLWVDSSVAGLFWTLTTGGTLAIPRPRAEQDPGGLATLVREAGVTHTLMVPSLYGAILDQLGEEETPELSTVILAGESTPKELVARHTARMPGASLINEYGPSEATVWATVEDLTRDTEGPVTIGRPVPSYSVHVLDPSLRPTGIAMEGEIVIGGPGVADGYLGAPDQTAERFLPDPVRGEGTVYRTGDRGRWLDDGRIQFLGRFDQQLKIRGFRVELEEIESSIRAHPQVRDVAVDAVREGSRSAPELVAYVVAESGAPGGADLEPWLADRVPGYMVPGRYLAVPALPRTPAGKLDRRGLQALEGREISAARAPSIPPRTPAESVLADIWREVLRVEQVGVHDDFFELGGDSLSSIRVLSQASRAGFEIDPETFFGSPTIAALAEGSSREAPAPWPEPVGEAPLTPVQRWFFDTVKDGREHWNQDRVLAFPPGTLRVEDVTAMLTALVSHHDALRTRFVFGDDGNPLRQEIGEPDRPWIRFVTAPSSEDEVLRTHLEEALGDAHRSMDLGRPELFRAVVVETGGHVRLLGLASHHLIVDAVSWGVLIEDLATLVGHYGSGAEPSLPPKTKPWTVWARELTQRAADLDGPLLIDVTAPRPESPSACSKRGMGIGLVGDAVRHTERLEPEELAALDTARVRMEVSMEDLLLAGFLHGWHDWCGETALLMDLEGHGRDRGGEVSDLYRTVGWFTSVTPFRGRLGVSPRDTLRAVQREVRRARGSGTDQALVRYLSPDPEVRAALSTRLATDVVFNYLGRAGEYPTDLPFTVERDMTEFARSPAAQRGYALEVNILVRDGGLDLVLEGGPGSEQELPRLGAYLRGALGTLSEAEPVPFDLAGFDDPDYETLTRLVGELEFRSGTRPAAAEAGVDDCRLLTPMQSLMLLHTEAVSQDTLVSQVEYELVGTLDMDAFESAWRSGVRRHGALRTAFLSEGLPRPVQVVLADAPFHLLRSDLSERSGEEQSVELARIRALDRRPLDIDRPPLMRVRLVRLGPDRHVLVWTVHHLIMDRWSQGLVLEDVREYYLGGGMPRRELPAAPQFGSFVEWVLGQDPLRVAQHWRPRLRDAPAGGVFGRSTEGQSGTRATWTVRLTAEDSARLGRLAERSRSTLAPWLLCGISAGVARISGRRDVLFGLTSAGRSAELPRVDQVVGSLVGNVPFRMRFSGDGTLGEAVAEVGARLVEQRFDHSSPSDLHGLTGLPPGAPLFDLLVVVNLDELMPSDWETFVLRPSSGSLDSGYPGVLSVTLEQGRITLQLVGEASLDGDRILGELARTMTTLASLDGSQSLEALLEGVPDGPVDAAPAVDLEEVRQEVLGIEGVADAVVVSSPELAAYLVPTRQADLRVGKIRRILRERLPRGWVPDSINFLMSLPRRTDGSVDTQALPPPAPAAYDAGLVPPSTEEEALVHRVWSQVLDIDELSVDEDFFHVGGTSIQMLQIANALEDRLGAPVPATTLLRHSTIRSLARRLEASRPPTATDQGSIVPIRSTGERTPLFLVHGRDGGVLFARFIAQYLESDRPVFGVQAFGGGLGDRSDISIEELASGYLDDVRRSTTGPLLLGGYSLGGVIAFEMARQASALGQPVDALVLLEPLLTEEPLPSSARLLRQRVGRVLGRKPPRTARLSPDEEDLPEAARRELIQFRTLLPPAVRRYRPRPLSVPVIYYASAGEAERRRAEWAEFAAGGFELIELPAGHNHMIAEPVVGELGRDLQRRLARAGITSG